MGRPARHGAIDHAVGLLLRDRRKPRSEMDKMGYLFGQKRRKVGPKRELSLARSHEIDRLSTWDQFRLRFHDL